MSWEPLEVKKRRCHNHTLYPQPFSFFTPGPIRRMLGEGGKDPECVYPCVCMGKAARAADHPSDGPFRLRS